MGEHTRTYLRSLRLSIEGTRAKEERGKEVAAFYHGAHNTRVSIYPRGEEREVCACVSRCVLARLRLLVLLFLLLLLEEEVTSWVR